MKVLILLGCLFGFGAATVPTCAQIQTMREAINTAMHLMDSLQPRALRLGKYPTLGVGIAQR